MNNLSCGLLFFFAEWYLVISKACIGLPQVKLDGYSLSQRRGIWQDSAGIVEVGSASVSQQAVAAVADNLEP